MRELGVTFIILVEIFILQIIHEMTGVVGLIFVAGQMVMFKLILLLLRWIKVCLNGPSDYLYICLFLPSVNLLGLFIGGMLDNY